ncbi:succinate dehydrogenase, cytochrome b556 subunit [Bartonella sp. DGB2]|uniref:succinate dehydrogenase, cytochrome b556 subunit n=1 Tax=Bartonella sp. DGB2 TaxID=3388426 RepID=UPI00398FAA8A
MEKATVQKDRPLSPHINIYRWPITMAMSIAHRISGGALYFGTIFLAAWLISAAYGPASFAYVNGLFSSLLGRIILFLYTLALVHHLVGGIRHLIWDAKPCLLEKNLASKTAWATIFITVVLTLVIWIIAYTIR